MNRRFFLKSISALSLALVIPITSYSENKEWYHYGKFHREEGGLAIEFKNKDKQWWSNNESHEKEINLES